MDKKIFFLLISIFFVLPAVNPADFICEDNTRFGECNSNGQLCAGSKNLIGTAERLKPYAEYLFFAETDMGCNGTFWLMLEEREIRLAYTNKRIMGQFVSYGEKLPVKVYCDEPKGRTERSITHGYIGKVTSESSLFDDCSFCGNCIDFCFDGTPIGQCSVSQDHGIPFFCSEKRDLVEDCFSCGCPENSRCTAKGYCERDIEEVEVHVSTEKNDYLVGENIRLSSEYELSPSQDTSSARIENPEFNGYIVVFNQPSAIEFRLEREKVSAKRIGGVDEIYAYVDDLRKAQDSVIGRLQNKITGNVAGRFDVKARYFSVLNGIWIDASEEQVEKLRRDPDVKSVSPGYRYNLTLQRSVSNINAARVTSPINGAPLTGKGISVAITDTGLDYTHPDFGSCNKAQLEAHRCPKIKDFYNFVEDNEDIRDDVGHGTHVAGIIGANGSLKGVAPEADLMIYKVCFLYGCDLGWILSGLERAIDPNSDFQYDDRADIISMSLGDGPIPPNEDPFLPSINNAAKVGSVVVISAGNEGLYGRGTIGSPGTIPKAITVGASCLPDQVWEQGYCKGAYPYIAGFSSIGPSFINDKPDIVAPGVDICSASSKNSYFEQQSDIEKCYDDKHIKLSGTSMAAPHVSGAVALIKQAHPDWDVEKIKNALKNTARSFGYPRYIQGSGLINVREALNYDKNINLGITEISGGSYDGLFDDISYELIPIYTAKDEITLQGNVKAEDFKSYSADIGFGLNPRTYNREGIKLRYNGRREINDEAMIRINPYFLSDGLNTIRIGVTDSNRNILYDYAYLYGDNVEITSPKDYDSFKLIVQTPANLPLSYSYYYIIRTRESFNYESGEYEIVETRIDGSKINIMGELNRDFISNYEVDYSYGGSQKSWYSGGVELSDEDDILATLDLKDLKYNDNFLDIRLRVYKGEEIIATEIVRVSIYSEIYRNLDIDFPSQIINLWNKKIEGLLSIRIEKYQKRAENLPEVWWAPYRIIEDRIPVTLLEKQTLDLTRIDKEGFSINEIGRYRMSVEFEHGDKIENAYYIFDVSEPSRGNYLDKCSDNTERNFCSVQSISYYCDSSLELVQNCNYCGCGEGFTCSSSGQCIATHGY